jgi:hypothetical protein
MPMPNTAMQMASSQTVHLSLLPVFHIVHCDHDISSFHTVDSACVNFPGLTASHHLSAPTPLHPHLFKALDNQHVGIHVSVDAVLHASILASCESALRQAAGDALLEADGVEFVDGCRRVRLACESLKVKVHFYIPEGHGAAVQR